MLTFSYINNWDWLHSFVQSWKYVLKSRAVYVPYGQFVSVKLYDSVSLSRMLSLFPFIFNKKVNIIMCFFPLSRVCVCVVGWGGVFDMIICQFMLWGGKQISNPQHNPSSCSDYKSAGALRSNQQEQSAAGTDTLSIRGGHHTVTLTRTHINSHICTVLHPHSPTHTLRHRDRYAPIVILHPYPAVSSFKTSISVFFRLSWNRITTSESQQEFHPASCLAATQPCLARHITPNYSLILITEKNINLGGKH